MKLINNLLIQIIPFLPKSFIKLFASPYIAGITDDEMLSTVKNLNAKGYDTAIDILGEHVKTEKEATEITEKYANLYDEISSRSLEANLSIKLTHIGQNSPYISETITLYKEALEVYADIGIVLQAYMYRSIDDLNALANEQFNCRVCKGIYIESEDIAYTDYEKIRENYIKLVQTGLQKGSYIGIAGHDEYLINHLYQWIQDNNIPKNQYEFQVLYGVPMEKILQKLIQEGNKIRVYVPYGDNWYDYSIRRLKENPKMAGYIIKNLFKKIFYFYK